MRPTHYCILALVITETVFKTLSRKAEYETNQNNIWSCFRKMGMHSALMLKISNYYLKQIRFQCLAKDANLVLSPYQVKTWKKTSFERHLRHCVSTVQPTALRGHGSRLFVEIYRTWTGPPWSMPWIIHIYSFRCLSKLLSGDSADHYQQTMIIIFWENKPT